VPGPLRRPPGRAADDVQREDAGHRLPRLDEHPEPPRAGASHAAARAYALEFRPLAAERYELTVPARLLDQLDAQALPETLAEDDFRRTVAELGGYDVSETGRRRGVGSAPSGRPWPGESGVGERDG